MNRFSLTVKCASTRGIVAAITAYLDQSGCNITDSAQYDDLETGNYLMRVRFVS